MKAKTLIILVVCAALPMMSWAAKPKKKAAAEPVVEEEPEIVTEDCVMYTSLFHESAKNKQYADALEPWLNVYKTCPSYSKNVYVDGDKIVECGCRREIHLSIRRSLVVALFDRNSNYLLAL